MLICLQEKISEFLQGAYWLFVQIDCEGCIVDYGASELPFLQHFCVLFSNSGDRSGFGWTVQACGRFLVVMCPEEADKTVRLLHRFSIVSYFTH